MSEINKEIEKAIDDIFHYAKSLHEQKENAKYNNGSYLSIGMRNALKEVKYSTDKLNSYMHEY